MKELYEQIEEGKNVVYLYRLHYRSYVHNWNIESYDFLEERFKMYYNIDEKVDIEVVNKNEYFNKIKNKN